MRILLLLVYLLFYGMLEAQIRNSEFSLVGTYAYVQTNTYQPTPIFLDLGLVALYSHSHKLALGAYFAVNSYGSTNATRSGGLIRINFGDFYSQLNIGYVANSESHAILNASLGIGYSFRLTRNLSFEPSFSFSNYQGGLNYKFLLSSGLRLYLGKSK